MHKFEIVIIGAGASGLMFASKYKDRDIAIIESNQKIAQKIKISGGGRCNVTNEHLSVKNYLGDSSFIKQIIDSFDQFALLDFLKVRGCEPKILKDGQYFCQKSSDEIIKVFQKEVEKLPIFLNHNVKKVTKTDSFYIHTHRGDFQAQKLIVASGGLSYPKIGASAIAYEIAKSFGHKVCVLSAALVGFTVQKDQFWMKELSGISLPVLITVGEKRFYQDILFTHRGISGPAILNASLYWYKGQIKIDFLPDMNIKDRLKNSKKLLSSALFLPKRFTKAFLKSIGLEDKPVDKLNDFELKKLLELKNYTFAPAGNFGYQKAEVTRGGVSTDEIDPLTMMSRVVKNLYFIGESLDVTGELGGYNFQWAFSSAWRVNL